MTDFKKGLESANNTAPAPKNNIAPHVSADKVPQTS